MKPAKPVPLFALLPLTLALSAPSASAQARAGVDAPGAIRAARATFQEAERAVAARRWVRADTTVKCDDEELSDDVTLHRDSTGTVRRLQWSGGTDDHAETHRYFYDATGRLRFAFFTLGAVNGTQREERVYYSENGEVVRRLIRLVRGPGYATEPEAGVRDPAAWLRRICQ